MPGLNEYINAERSNKYKASSIKRNVEKDLGFVIQNALSLGKLHKHNKTCCLEIEWVEENNRRDGDNISFATKFIQDALVRNGIFPDDNRKYIDELHHTFKTEKGINKVIVKIKEKQC